MTSNAYIRQLDPIQGLVDYVEDIKPYHTKIVEVSIEYVYDDSVNVRLIEGFELSWGPSQVAVVSAGSPDDDFTIQGDWSQAIEAGDTIVGINQQGSPQGEIAYTVVSSIHLGSPVNTTALTTSPSSVGDETHIKINKDIVTYFVFDVTSIDEEQQTITVSGPATTDIFNGQQLRILGTTSNDGVFTVQGSPTFNGLTTTIPVAEPLTNESGVGTVEPIYYFTP